MKYLLLIYGNEEKWASIPEEILEKERAKQDAWNKRYHATGELLGAYGLGGESEASLVRTKDGSPFTTDGPYLEAKEFVCSLYLLDVASAERAREIAAEMPWAADTGVEVWPVLHDAFGAGPDGEA
ncbi:YciI family protein [Catenulispora rubra]|uniref:YciI family protein n=1 Tax=Catenulispora rubra TaxID=280293 RepID=UPI00189260AB|nr:YciI family protein [Catenulispora rubra]